MARRQRRRCCFGSSKIGAAVAASFARHHHDVSAVHTRVAHDDIDTVSGGGGVRKTIIITTIIAATSAAATAVSTTASAVLHGDRFGRCVCYWLVSRRPWFALRSGPGVVCVFRSLSARAGFSEVRTTQFSRGGGGSGFRFFLFFFHSTLSCCCFSPSRHPAVPRPTPFSFRHTMSAVHDVRTVYRNTIYINTHAPPAAQRKNNK